ncbi:MAG: hypothetical protein ACPGWR_06095 [Ardenticatenaceae bacterium]
MIVSEDGRILTGQEPLQPPLPEADPRFLDEFVARGGAVTRQVLKTGTLITIRAPNRQDFAA